MSDDREKLLKIISSLEADYRSGKISADKYSYFRAKYEDKLNTIDAEAATKKIRSMQGKSSSNTKKRKRSKRPTSNKKKEEDLVQKYIINPKKGDAKYNKAKKSSMDGGTFKLLLLLVLVIGFTAGVAYGVFNFDFDTLSQTESVATVQDTAFPEFHEVLKNTTKTTTSHNNNSWSTSQSTVETTTDTSNTPSSDSSDSQGSNQPTPTPTPSPSDGGSSSEGGGQQDGGNPG